MIFPKTTSLLCFLSLISLYLCTAQNVTKFENVTTSSEVSISSSVNIDVVDLELKRNFIKQMMLDSWTAYSTHAFGHDLLKPFSKITVNYGNPYPRGDTILASMSTLWVMGLREEFAFGKRWIQEHFNFTKVNTKAYVDEVVTEFMGALLSCYALTGDRIFVDKAKEVADLLKPAYNLSTTGLPSKVITPSTGSTNGSKWDAVATLSQISGHPLEHNYLSFITNDTKYQNRLKRICEFFRKSTKPNGLYPERVNIYTGKWESTTASLLTNSREFYQNLVKSFIQSNGKDQESLQIYREAMHHIEQVGMFSVSNKTGLTYALTYDTESKTNGNWMQSDACYLGSMLGLGAKNFKIKLNQTHAQNVSREEFTEEHRRIERHAQLGENLTETCHQAAVQTKTGLLPVGFVFNEALFTFDSFSDNLFNESYISPEIAESYLVLWRVTHKQKYRDYAWQLAQAIQSHSRTKSGAFTNIRNVNQIPTEKEDIQRKYFLSGTLKYLYLTFTDDTVLPLDSWVFNSVGHPLPVFK